MKRHILSIWDLSARDIVRFMALTARLKRGGKRLSRALAGKTIALVFEKQSTRTRLAAEAACVRLGAYPVTIAGRDLQIGRGETVEDSARVFSRFVDAVCWRTTAQERLEAFARAGTIPVINTLSDLEHPTQILADLFTLKERFRGPLPPLAFIGDGGCNVAHSWLLAAARLGMDFRLAFPPGYSPGESVAARASAEARKTGARILLTQDPFRAASGAKVLYTDVWVSMGQEKERNARMRRLKPYQLNSRLLSRARPGALVMHCLPAHRGDEITASVMDGPRSIVFDQAENRLYSTQAALIWCLKGGEL